MSYWPSAIGRQLSAIRCPPFAFRFGPSAILAAVILSGATGGTEVEEPHTRSDRLFGPEIRTRTLFRFYLICGIMSMRMTGAWFRA